MYKEMIPLVGYMIVGTGLGFALSLIFYGVLHEIDETLPKVLGLYFCALCVIYIIMNIVVWKG